MNMDQEIEKWLKNSLSHLSVRNPMSIHLDMLLHRAVNKADVIQLSLQSFQILVEQLKGQQMPAKPGLVIPLLGEDIYLQANVPTDFEDINRQLNDEPPSLYLLDWEVGRYLDVCEEYKCPLDFNLFDEVIEGVYTYYREFRDKLAIKNGWEFSRAIYLEYYPANYHL